MLKKYFTSSIGKKQVVAVSGLFLILFLIAHLAGNLFIYGGPEVFNKYAATLKSLGPVLVVIESVLTLIFVTHIVFTAMVVIENKKSRPVQYAAGTAYKERSLATRLMPYTGTVLLVYLITHLCDFTFSDPTTSVSVFAGQQLGLYGLVVHAFMNPLWVAWYVVAMIAVGFHLVHAFQSVMQTFGINHPYYTPFIKKFSLAFGIFISLAFSIIPLYIWLVVAPSLG